MRDHFRDATLPPAGKAAPADKPNEVHALLALNARKAEAAGANELPPQPRRPSRRRQDYWISLLGGGGGIAVAVILAGANPISVLFGFAGIVVLVAALTWVFWFVMDDY